MFILQLTLGTADCFMYIWESQPVPNLTSSLYVTALEPYPLVTIQAYVCPGLQIRVCIGKLFSLFLIQNICCGYSKEPSQ